MLARHCCSAARSSLGLALVAVAGLSIADGLALPSVVAQPASGLLAEAKNVAPPVTTTSSQAAIELARHLSWQGAVLYVAYWCPHCFEQKQMFGREASAELKVVECAPDGFQNQAALCQQKQLVGYPSWEIDGQVDVGVKSLRRLSELSRFPNAAAF